MMWSTLKITAVFACFSLSLVLAQFPKQPEGVTVLESRFGDGVQISYKEVSRAKSDQSSSQY
jgi:hypothetical protein